MVPHDQARSVSSTKRMQIASNRQALNYFMPSWLQKICWSMVQMYQTLLLKHHHLSRDFSFDLTVHSTNGGWLISNGPLYPRTTSSRYYQPCKAIWNPLASGKSTLMQSFVTLASSPQSTSLVYIWVSSMVSKLFSNDKLMTLQLPLLTSVPPTYSLTC